MPELSVKIEEILIDLLNDDPTHEDIKIATEFLKVKTNLGIDR